MASYVRIFDPVFSECFFFYVYCVLLILQVPDVQWTLCLFGLSGIGKVAESDFIF